ncbi:hypothetical protein K502DRAFT_322428 [Neoconidiobolus thromboides FSU 785]|nr:hypothetical protein K502DRAFT_322428 [Neoconidiobolus thromboides FSU 785]
MKFTSIILVTLAAFSFVSAASQTAPSIPPAGEAVTPVLNTAPKSNVQAKTFGLIAYTLKSAFNLLFGGFGKPYGHGGYYNGYPYYSGILGWNGYNQYYGNSLYL